jgi:hypothetical protein
MPKTPVKNSLTEYLSDQDQVAALLTRTGNLLSRIPSNSIFAKTIDQTLVDFNLQIMIYEHKLTP